jgi:hypothetical protein
MEKYTQEIKKNVGKIPFYRETEIRPLGENSSWSGAQPEETQNPILEGSVHNLIHTGAYRCRGDDPR